MNNINLLMVNVKNLPKTLLRFINVIISLLNKYQEAYPTREYIAEKLNVTPQHVSRLSEWLVVHGWITKTYRHLSSCIYKLPDFFFDFWTRVALRPFFPAIKSITLQVGMLSGSSIKEMLHNIYIGNTSYRDFVMKNDLVMKIGHELRMSKEQRAIVEQYDLHVIQYSMGVLNTKIDSGIEFKGIESRIKYFLSILKSEAARKWRPYDPKGPLFKDKSDELPVVTDINPHLHKRSKSCIIAADLASIESIIDLEPLDNYDPVIDLSDSESTTPPFLTFLAPTKEEFDTPIAPMIPILAPPPANKPSITSDNSPKESNTAKQPSLYKPFVSKVDDAEVRKERSAQIREKNKKTQQYCSGAYGQSIVEVKKEAGIISLAELLKPVIE